MKTRKKKLDGSTLTEVANYMNSLIANGTPESDVIMFTQRKFGFEYVTEPRGEKILAGVIAGRAGRP